MDKIPLGQNIAVLRKAQGVSQCKLAEALGYTSQAISKFEAGESSLTLMILPALANFFHLTLDDLFTRNETPAPTNPLNPPFDANRITDNLLAARLAHHLSQKDEGEALGVAKRTIIHYEKGESLPSFEVIERLLAFYQLTPNAFFYSDLYPEERKTIEEKRQRKAKPLLLFLLGFFLGGGLLTGILVPTLQARSSSSAPYQYTSSSTNSSSTSTSNSSSLIPGLSKLVVITTSGQSRTCGVVVGHSISFTLYAEPTFDFTSVSRKAYPATYSIDGAGVDVSMLKFVESDPYPVVSLAIPSDFPGGSVLTINAQITSASDPSVVFKATSIELVVYRA
jgi:transcriptional regulator with XRE-family HTH domain